EQSGHLVFLDHASTGDGIIGALQVLALMMRSGQPLSELAAASMERVPQVLENVTLPRRRPLEEMAQLARVAEGVRATLGGGGRGRVRGGGTEPKPRIMRGGPGGERIGAGARARAEAARRDVT